jgi:hypothetical protein
MRGYKIVNEINKTAGHVIKESINDNCKGCSKVLEDSTCSAYIKPNAWWRRGKCPLADHIKTEVETKRKVRVGQQKQKKRG